VEIIKRFEKAVDQHLSLATLPIAVKLLEKEEDIPANMSRPIVELGEPIRPCEGWHFARHKGLSIAMLKDDFSTACPHAIFIFGILEPTQSYVDGDLTYEIYTTSRKAAMNMERNIFRLDFGRYEGVVFAPLSKANFVPDLVMTYCDSRQAMRLVTAAEWADGEPLTGKIAARCICSEGIVQPFLKGEPVVGIPCGGDREHGKTQDDELVFTAPVSKLEGIIEGLKLFQDKHKIPSLGGESKLIERYSEMARSLDQELGRLGS
jgi:uncharacterized protein (DUF169 family)